MYCLRLVLNKNLEEELFTVSEHAENLHGARGPGQTKKNGTHKEVTVKCKSH